MQRIDAYFLLAAAISLVVGVSLGIFMGVTQAFQYMHIHAHINLIGWTSMALFGLSYRAFPALAGSRLAPAHFGLAIVGALIFLPGLPVAMFYGNPIFAIIGSLIWLAGAACFLVNVARTLFRPAAASSSPVGAALA